MNLIQNFDFKSLLIDKEQDVLSAMKQLNQTGKKILFVVEEGNKLVGTLTDGDIRRYILKTGNLKGLVKNVCNKNPFVAYLGENIYEIIQKIRNKNIKFVPIIDNNREIIEIVFLNHKGIEISTSVIKSLDIPVIIMAGGFGTRLEPFTKILPKPLIPIGDKTVLEIIMEKFYGFGTTKFWISVNYKAYIIKSYLAELNLPYQLTYIQEEKPLGTVGSLFLLKNKIDKEDFFLTNCDIIVDSDYLAIYEYHRKSKNDITIVASTKKFIVPYGVCNVKDGVLVSISEKPEFNFLVNTGMYIFKSNIIDLIPENQFFNVNDLITIASKNGKRIGLYPISDENWIDIGQWDEYKNALKKFNL